MIYDPKVATQGDPAAPENRTFMFQYQKDRRSIYVGNLPEYVGKDFLRMTFGRFATIVDISLRQCRNGQGKHLKRSHGLASNAHQDTILSQYAFIEFDSDDAPDRAVQSMVSSLGFSYLDLAST